MIRSFRHKGLQKLWNDDDASGIRPDLVERVRARLTALDAATKLKELRVPGWRLHVLKGNPTRYSLTVNGPWRVTFGWRDGDAWRVDLEQYH
ncbi:MAG: type II toxin-antitoxin system RelE/ParE family toxin [Gemmatimonadota bacterium]